MSQRKKMTEKYVAAAEQGTTKKRTRKGHCLNGRLGTDWVQCLHVSCPSTAELPPHPPVTDKGNNGFGMPPPSSYSSADRNQEQTKLMVVCFS